ncbi:MAG: ATP-binding protein [Holophagales bacterium]|nr:ATP-binding protein [Holophagales bacterium]
MIDRAGHRDALRDLLEQFPVVGLVGARQVGKTTLARDLAGRQHGSVHHFDREDPRHRARLDDPVLALEPLEGLVILDEVQLRPEIFPVLRVLVDRDPSPSRFLVLGSASPELLRQGSETLAGRIAYLELPPLSLAETGARLLEQRWLRGGFPLSLLADSDARSERWRQAFIRTYLSRDLAELGIDLPPETMRRFWSMLAHYHGDTWNGSELARAFGVSQKTVLRYLDTLCSTFMARRLAPWHENLAKRQVKAPKVYLTDSGILHSLLGLDSRLEVLGHPKAGASWEGFVLEELLQHLGTRQDEAHFWKIHAGAELDLFVHRGNRRLGFEIKLTTAPTTRRSMHTAIDALSLDELVVVHAGDDSFPMRERIRAVALRRLQDGVEPL